jgi:hypothetical protein
MGRPDQAAERENDARTGGHPERRPEDAEERRRRLEKSLEQGLEDTFPASDAVSVVQPPPSVLDQKSVLEKGARDR